MTTRRELVRLLAVAAPTLASGCATPPPPPAVCDLAIQGGADQNPDQSGAATPVAVHFYQLAGTAKFERADVFALIDREQQTLGRDLLGSEEFVLSPGETRTISRELTKGAQFAGIAVLFRDIDHARWRAFAPVASSGPSKLALKITKLSVALEKVS